MSQLGLLALKGNENGVVSILVGHVHCIGWCIVGGKPYGKAFLFYPIATYPSAGGRCGAHGCVFQERKMHGVATNVYLRKMLKKLERYGLRTLSV